MIEMMTRLNKMMRKKKAEWLYDNSPVEMKEDKNDKNDDKIEKKYEEKEADETTDSDISKID